ncbi:TetR/AcrR family transcriptional regulator [Gordonia sp. ABSL1-1]|uniref:TetR/AcrR family transcriptional regulator n=1 Tax=Gordonia sp. ABSL1-1 TaxID=3053923 RepID=UPI002573D121|nr:TetR/AcrR family transcriptional regulator [Gordonia sp. ABSL1-1]MDL9935687.1 TetR/AcrR family transcriptional regulator [Gordonia sp. ABSL1-1]
MVESTSPDSIRCRLVDAGVALLDEGGADAVGLRAITRRAGVSHGAPRRHFPTHRALLAAIARRGLEDLTQLLVPILTAPLPDVGNHPGRSGEPAHRLRRAGQVYVDVAVSRRAMFELMFRHDILDGAGADLRALSVPLVGALHEMVIAGLPDPALPDPDRWARTAGLWTALHGIAILTANRTLEPLGAAGAITPGRLIADAVDHALR